MRAGAAADPLAGFEPDLQAWWSRCSREQRAALGWAARADRMDVETARLLSDTRCPIGLLTIRLDVSLEAEWSWSPYVREFVKHWG